MITALNYKLGVIGLDTSHAVEFTRIFNSESGTEIEVTAAYPWGSAAIRSSAERIPGYQRTIEEMGVTISDSVGDLVEVVDGVLLLTNDGNLRLKQAREVLEAGRPVFIDKPFAANLSQVLALLELVRLNSARVFSSSALRYAQGVAESSVAHPIGCDTSGPCYLEPSHSDLFWYGIHGIEMLVAVMGPGCRSVIRHSGMHSDVVVSRWDDGRIGTYRGLKHGQAVHGGTAFLEDRPVRLGGFEGFDALAFEIRQFFLSEKQPVTLEETAEIYTLMAAAEISSERGDVPVELAEARELAMANVPDTLELVEKQEVSRANPPTEMKE